MLSSIEGFGNYMSPMSSNVGSSFERKVKFSLGRSHYSIADNSRENDVGSLDNFKVDLECKDKTSETIPSYLKNPRRVYKFNPQPKESPELSVTDESIQDHSIVKDNPLYNTVKHSYTLSNSSLRLPYTLKKESKDESLGTHRENALGDWSSYVRKKIDKPLEKFPSESKVSTKEGNQGKARAGRKESVGDLDKRFGWIDLRVKECKATMDKQINEFKSRLIDYINTERTTLI